MPTLQRRMALGEFIPSVLIYALGWATATVMMAFALHLAQTKAWPQALLSLFVLVGGSLAVGVSARLSAKRRESGRATAEGLGWSAAFAVAVIVFWFWAPLADLTAAFARHRPPANAVTATQATDSGDMTTPYPPDVGSGTSFRLSEVQIRLLVAVCVFGSVGGFASRLPIPARRRRQWMDSALSALIWGLAVLIGSACLFVGFYLFVGIFAAVLKPAVGLGVALGAALAGLVGGAVSATLAMPVQQRLVDFAAEE